MPDLDPETHQGAHQRAAAYLRELLLRPGRHRRKWEQFSERGRPGQVNQLAVAEVLAHYLWDNPRTAADIDVLPRQLKDTTSRALSGTLLSKATLQLFMEAFDLPDFEREQLLKLWEGTGTVRFLQGQGAMGPKLVSDVEAALGPRGHKSVVLHDHALIGADRQLARVRTMQVIEAIRSGVDRIPYIHDTAALTVQAGLGCIGISEPLGRIAEGVFATHLLLAKRLELGETLALEYWTVFRHDPDIALEPEYRRVVMRSVENVDIRVEFAPEAMPSSVWWAVWSGFEGGIADDEQVELDGQHSAHRFLRSAEKTVVGFHWDW
ncbi:MAG TPA: hypothetical protein VKU39_20465 [Streptosporangiaceae bacterium]|nr:hypothetical protein [Streptosporangiaceae bacterium]